MVRITGGRRNDRPAPWEDLTSRSSGADSRGRFDSPRRVIRMWTKSICIEGASVEKKKEDWWSKEDTVEIHSKSQLVHFIIKYTLVGSKTGNPGVSSFLWKLSGSPVQQYCRPCYRILSLLC